MSPVLLSSSSLVSVGQWACEFTVLVWQASLIERLTIVLHSDSNAVQYLLASESFDVSVRALGGMVRPSAFRVEPDPR